ncbi:MAG: hypothetical protein SF051_05325 [Elusimicrobiota bacterium]|nr:hypothetical protein [Elusimicrobiota bacterium]
MAHQQLASTNEGAQKEAFAGFVLSGICAPTAVPRQQDYGLDFYCALTQPDGHVIRTSPYSFGLQVKTRADDNVLTYGGYKNKNDPASWKAYEIEWLFNQSIPFLIGLAAKDCSRLDLYLTSGMWKARWMGGRPFQVDLVPGDPGAVTKEGLVPTAVVVEGAPGDGHRWTVPLGPPIVSMEAAKATVAAGRAKVREVLARALDVDRLNVMAHALGVPYREWILAWKTGELPAPTETRLGNEWFANGTEGQNLEQCAKVLSFSLAALALNLKAQGQVDALKRLRDTILLVDGIRPMPAGIKAEITKAVE